MDTNKTHPCSHGLRTACEFCDSICIDRLSLIQTMTVNNKKLQEAPVTNSNEMKIALQILMDAVLNLIQKDPHQWSIRPCATCQAISSIIEKPFGCYLYASLKNKETE